MKRYIISIILIILLLSPLYSKIKKEKLNLLLISIDTLRADYLSCYGGKEVKTKNIDSLTKNGILFKKAFAHNPLTLPSHTNILTGLTPLFHGVHENLGFRLSENILTLAEYLKKYNYRTAAFVGSFPLDSRFGLDQGFDLYDDLYGEKKSPGAFFFVERKGEEVVNRAIKWLKSHQNSRWFLFIHLFDPHQPYIPPSPYLERFAYNLYAGEVAYVDDCVGKLLNYLRKSNLMDKTLIIFTSDHGESLGEHGERTHGYFAYNSTLHVPLIFHSRKFFKENKIIEKKVSHIDIFPTVCDLFGLKKPKSLQGQSLLPLIEGKKFTENTIYFESLSAYYNRNWAPLRGIIEKDYKFIDLPIPELYNIKKDFEEKNNLADKKNLAKYRNLLKKTMDKLSKGGVETSRKIENKKVLEAMRSLGYLSGGTFEKKRVFTRNDDLKVLLPFHLKLMDAASLHSQGNIEKTIEILEGLIKEKKDFATAYEYLANVYHQIGKKEKAIEVLRKGLNYFPNHVQMRGKLGIYLSEVGRLNEAIKELKHALALNDKDAELWNYLGVAYWRSGNYVEAEKCYQRSIELDFNYASAFNNLGSLYLSLKNPDKALYYFEKAIKFDPTLASAYNGKAVALGMKGNLIDAIEYWKKAVQFEPNHQMALYNLGLAFLKINNKREALKYFERYLKVAPSDDRDRERILKLVKYLKNQIE
ncbi:sulfatase-like hydrolase/transferase [Candidatus Aminicenantes bacterium AC-335-A11]|jgi:arylsulfatase A-like enzyme/Flp pilus assembly protein TadD|nr:sulfatase-like hydrolase/transferase [SCandidatus Aminicenantes bacterium Aminicenantia_JdfR_composite]MCP2597132.1 sulfatase-like hydrolase/transferase [Candidatus Aminicenantes bacterium AC-335-G13]MCP2618611.1 sulfatase-like hydrolase/transferase [Candidatus Aminicenantes bacterium AC-335-A11]MCP2621101.1 sulfatase-like hydrolase/transferase [Candidatus Aminicenantes bacterium AC-334-E05]